MTGEIQPLLDRLDALIANLDTTQRRRLATEVARSLRGTQARRIKDNQNPDGTPFETRKPQPQLRERRGSLRMFSKLQRTRWLKPKGSSNEASLGFAGFAGQVAREHQYGLRVRVNRSGQQVKMPERQLLGLTEDEFDNIEQLVIRHLNM